MARISFFTGLIDNNMSWIERSAINSAHDRADAAMQVASAQGDAFGQAIASMQRTIVEQQQQLKLMTSMIGVLAAVRDAPTDVGRDTGAWAGLARELARLAAAQEAQALLASAATAEPTRGRHSVLTRRETRARRLLTPALAKMFLRWSCTVCGLMNSAVAISSRLAPRSESRRTWHSRRVSP